MSDSILQVNQIKDKGGNATGITIADSTANISIGTTLAVNTINEVTSANGVTVDGLSLKDGNVVPATGKGIDFSAASGSNAGSANALLDDYEEGTFTPTLSVGTLTTARGFYTKVGRICTVSFQIAGFSDTSSNSAIRINNLPFSSSTDFSYSGLGSIGIYRYISHSHDQLGLYVPDSSTELQLWSSNKDGAYQQALHNQIGSGSSCTVYGMVTYATT